MRPGADIDDPGIGLDERFDGLQRRAPPGGLTLVGDLTDDIVFSATALVDEHER